MGGEDATRGRMDDRIVLIGRDVHRVNRHPHERRAGCGGHYRDYEEHDEVSAEDLGRGGGGGLFGGAGCWEGKVT